MSLLCIFIPPTCSRTWEITTGWVCESTGRVHCNHSMVEGTIHYLTTICLYLNTRAMILLLVPKNQGPLRSHTISLETLHSTHLSYCWKLFLHGELSVLGLRIEKYLRFGNRTSDVAFFDTILMITLDFSGCLSWAILMLLAHLFWLLEHSVCELLAQGSVYQVLLATTLALTVITILHLLWFS